MSKESQYKFIKREVYEEVLEWLEEPEIIALAGPRQSGKTTILKKIEEDSDLSSVFISFEKSSAIESFQDAPLEFIGAYVEEGKELFLLDEVQYVDQAGKKLKLLYDEFPSVKFIITGSSSLKIEEIASYLVGRVVFFKLFPFSFSEFLSAKDETLFEHWKKINGVWRSFFDGSETELPNIAFKKELDSAFEEYVTFGGYPAVVLSDQNKKERRLKSLIETYIEKDVVKLLQIGDFLEFRNVVKILAAQMGGSLSYASLSDDAEVGYRKAKKFVSSLDRTFVVKALNPYFTNRVSEIKKTPKIYFWDLGLRNSLLKDHRPLGVKQDKGLIAENFVAEQLLYRSFDLSYWRTKQGAEVDFICRHEDEIIPIEVKFKSFEEESTTRSFNSFLENYKPEKAVIITRDFLSRSKIGETDVLYFPIHFL